MAAAGAPVRRHYRLSLISFKITNIIMSHKCKAPTFATDNICNVKSLFAGTSVVFQYYD